jgi:hypothetical protein
MGELIEQMSPDPEEWDGDYFTNAVQWVTDEDTAHIADALGLVLGDVPDFDTDPKWVNMS